VRARMPQQCEDTPDRQHDETDKTHGRILTGQFADGKPETVPGRIGMAALHHPDSYAGLQKESGEIRKNSENRALMREQPRGGRGTQAKRKRSTIRIAEGC
jgi:hypothetical protein